MGSVTKATPIQFTDGKSGIKKQRGCIGGGKGGAMGLQPHLISEYSIGF